MKLTYCNPLSIPDVPSGRWLDTNISRLNERDYKDYRSMSDPSVIYDDGKWILYPSYGLAWVSEDFVHWKKIDIGIPNLRYSPAVVKFRGKWYLSGHGLKEVYVSDAATGPFKLCGRLTNVDGNEFKVPDGCFLADVDKDGNERLYLYWCGHAHPESGDDVETITATMGVEMDPDKPWQAITSPVVINRFNPDCEWQRHGEYNQNRRMGWIEGQWMIKKNGRYYLLYSGSGTQFSSYACGVAYSDEGPLSGFVPQKNHDPLTEKRHGVMRGAGHGCIAEGPNDTLWVFYTCTFNYNYIFERRIGMDPLGIDEDSELYCPAVTDTPQFAPGVLEHPELGNDTGLLPLTIMTFPKATSCAPGRDPIYASDDSMLSWWQPADDDKEPCITYKMGDRTRYDVSALRIIWRDIGMETLDGIMPGPFKFVVEYADDPKGENWNMLIDASENTEDLCIDYRQFETVTAHHIRLRILGAPEGITPGLVSLTAFGTAHCEK